MQVSVSSRHIELAGAVSDFARKKVENLGRLFAGLTEIEIILDAADGGHVAELIAHQKRGEKFVAESRATDMYEAIAAVIEKMDHQLRKKKQILKKRRKRGSKETSLPGEAGAMVEESGEIEEAEEGTV